ncbi:MAG: methyltransferase [Legionellaceae bacterium]|nr:methyltransferase [Legionellaceae bacterium]
MSENQNAFPQIIERAMYGFMLSQILFTGDELGIFNVFSDGKHHSAEEVAHTTQTNAYAIECLLLAAVANGLLEKREQHYALPHELIPFLALDSEHYCGGRFPHYRDSTTKTFQFLKQSMLDGKPQINRLVGETSGNPKDIFKNIYAKHSSTSAFLGSMWGLGFAPATELMQQYTLDQYTHLVDLGGATGSFAIAALQANPHLHATIYDLPEVEPFFNEKRGEYGLVERMKFEAGDFFSNDIPSGDIYVLGYILSDWSTETGTELLTKLYNKLPTNGLVIILEKLFNDDKTGPIQTAMMNLAMLLETEGQHRSLKEYTCWLNNIGFERVKCLYSSGEKHMIIGQKK